MPSSRPSAGARPFPEARPGGDSAADLIRWAAFSCVLVPVVLLWYGTSPAGAAGTALGLAAVTAVCRVLLRRSERCAARAPAPTDEYDYEHEPHAPRTPGTPGAGRGPRTPSPASSSPASRASQASHRSPPSGVSPAPPAARRPHAAPGGRRRRGGTGSHRGGRHNGGSSPVG